MNWKTWTPLALAIVLGLIAAKVARDALTRGRDRDRSQAKSVNVVVAKGPVAPGQELTKDVLALSPISAEAPPPGAFTDVAAVAGRVTVTPMFPGQPVLETLLAAKGTPPGLQALVPRGMRAITVEVNETSGLAGMIVPGCRVDVVSTLSGANKDDSVSCTIVQDVLVQAVGQRLTPGPDPDQKDAQPVRSVTLIATPRDAEVIDLASSTGRTRLVLRGSNDRSLTESEGVTYVELRGLEAVLPPLPPVLPPVEPPVAVVQPPPLPATQPAADPFVEPVPTKRTVALIKGGTRTEVVFDLSGRPAGPQAVDGKTGEAAPNNVVTSTSDGGDTD